MKKALCFAITVFFLYLAVRHVEWDQMWTVVSRAQWRYVIAAIPLLIAAYLIRALRWLYLFPLVLRKEGLRYVFPTLMVGYLGNNFLPGRAGEIARIILMGRFNKLSPAGVLSTIVAERTFDGLLLSLMGLAALRQMQLGGFSRMEQMAVVFASAFVVVLTIGLFRKQMKQLAMKISDKFPGHLPKIVAQKVLSMLDYLESVTTVLGFARIVLLSGLTWLLEVCVYAFVASSFGLWLNPFQLGVFLVAVNFASLWPTSPGGIGTIELAATEALVLSGVGREVAFAMVVTQHALQYFFCLLIGLYYTRRLGFSLVGMFQGLQSSTLLDVDDLVRAQVAVFPEAVCRYQETAPKDGLYLSVVIPAYNEKSRLLPTLLSVMEYFSHTGFSCEVIVVDDGSQDETSRLVQELGRRFSNLRLICLPRNMGKGAAVRTGIRNATGSYVLFYDADGATPIQEIWRLFAAMDRGADIAIGSRALYSPETRVERLRGRAVAGRIFAFLVNVWVLSGIADTQCGFKMFRREVARRIFRIQKLDGFAFDVEVLRIASLLGYKIVEIPINWTNIEGSKVRLLSDSFRMARDVIRIRYLVPSSLSVTSQALEPDPRRPASYSESDSII